MRRVVSQRSRTILSGLFLVGCGYVAGAFLNAPKELHAQEADPTAGYEEIKDDITAVYGRLVSLQESLEAEGKHTSAVDGPNAFAVAMGGVDAIRDLEEDRGVDPETFAALYAGRANPQVFPHLGKDTKGRVTYKGKLVRMYSRDKLRQLYKRRDSLTSASR